MKAYDIHFRATTAVEPPPTSADVNAAVEAALLDQGLTPTFATTQALEPITGLDVSVNEKVLVDGERVPIARLIAAWHAVPGLQTQIDRLEIEIGRSVDA